MGLQWTKNALESYVDSMDRRPPDLGDYEVDEDEEIPELEEVPLPSAAGKTKIAPVSDK